jgi:hypothetical protein
MEQGISAPPAKQPAICISHEPKQSCPSHNAKFEKPF